jgi:hypothetical protein
MMDLLHSLRKWFELALVITIAGFLFIHFVLKPSSTITLPGGQVINLDTSSFNNSVKQMLKKQDETNKKVNDLESTIRQLQSTAIGHDIPMALKETDIRKSVGGMLNAW